MSRAFKAIFAATILGLSFAAPVAAGPGEDAMVAYARGDYATAVQLLRPLADQGDAQAQYNLGVLYENGQGVPQNSAEAVEWYRKAAEQGEARAQNNLASMYASGQGVPQNYAEAMKWLRRAADQENARAQQGLGFMYLSWRSRRHKGGQPIEQAFAGP